MRHIKKNVEKIICGKVKVILRERAGGVSGKVVWDHVNDDDCDFSFGFGSLINEKLSSKNIKIIWHRANSAYFCFSYTKTVLLNLTIYHLSKPIPQTFHVQWKTPPALVIALRIYVCNIIKHYFKTFASFVSLSPFFFW